MMKPINIALLYHLIDSKISTLAYKRLTNQSKTKNHKHKSIIKLKNKLIIIMLLKIYTLHPT
jgi:hypothetical protein